MNSAHRAWVYVRCSPAIAIHSHHSVCDWPFNWRNVMAVVTLRQLLDAGVHYGHQTRRWNPKMRRFILGERNGIYLIDLKKTLKGIEESYTYVRDLVADGGSIMFVGTKKQIQGPIAEYADACGMPYVNQYALPGRCKMMRPPRRATPEATCRMCALPPASRRVLRSSRCHLSQGR